MQAIVKFLNFEKGFGFLRFSSGPDSRLDGEALFKDADLTAPVSVGDTVDFVLEDSERGPRAHDIIPIVIPRFKGVVSSAGPRKYGFIQSEDGRDIFYSHQNVVPDLIGRRGMPIGTPVSFEIDLNRIDKHEHATNVRNEDPALAQIVDPENYREIGKVRRWEGAEGTVKRGRIERPNGDSILFGGDAVVSERLEDIRLGTRLEYGLDIRLFLFDLESEVFYHRVAAREVFVCERHPKSSSTSSYEPGSFESLFASAPELPLAEPTVMPRKVGEIYTPQEKRTTLRDLIQQRKQSAA
jgi:cold shock CspA family protein